MRARKLPLAFFRQGAETVAAGLIGKILVHRLRDGRVLRARVVETEAYLGPKDLASHSSKGRTQRTEVMFGPPGRAYVYFIYGMHEMFNVVVGKAGEAEAVLIRGAEPLDGWDVNLAGPGRLARAFEIHRGQNHLRVTADELFFLDDGHLPTSIGRSRRIGVEYARQWADRDLRFYDPLSKGVSKVPRRAAR
jgi:DNA-3-methyladenine glycosylase